MPERPRSDNPTLAEIREAVFASVCLLYTRDSQLLQSSANERSLTHRLAVYLEQSFPLWDVDCEYNRLGDDPKRLPFEWPGRKTDLVFPDIIVHRRGPAGPNLLVIEVKPTNEREENLDEEKLRSFVADPNYGYDLGVFLRLGPEGCEAAKAFLKDDQEEDWIAELRQRLSRLGYPK